MAPAASATARSARASGEAAGTGVLSDICSTAVASTDVGATSRAVTPPAGMLFTSDPSPTATTWTETVHVPFGATEPPESARRDPAGSAVNVPPQVFAASGADAFARPAG